MFKNMFFMFFNNFLHVKTLQNVGKNCIFVKKQLFYIRGHEFTQKFTPKMLKSVFLS